MFRALVAFVAVLSIHPIAGQFLHGAEPQIAERVIGEFDIAKDGDLLLLPVSVGGKQYSFLLNTGGQPMVYDESLADLLGKPIGEVQLNGIAVATYESPAATLGGISLRTESPVCAVDLQQVREFTGLDIRGVIGMSALRSYALRINFDEGLLTVLDRVNPSCGDPIDLTYTTEGLPRIIGVLPEVGIDWFCVVTGWTPSLSITRPQFEILKSSKNINRVRPTDVLVIDSLHPQTAGILDTFRLGSLEVGPLRVTSFHITNAIGLEFLSRFIVTLDFPNNVVYLKPGKAFSRQYSQGLCGIAPIRRNGQTIVRKYSPTRLQAAQGSWRATSCSC